jgi:hypothetical protein
MKLWGSIKFPFSQTKTVIIETFGCMQGNLAS